MPSYDERYGAAKSLIERVLMQAEDDQLQDLVVEAIVASTIAWVVWLRRKA
jgi:hypothetical protein